MKKSLELSQPTSCLNKALDDELIFVLLERDEATAEAVRAWVDARVRLGKNTMDDPQIQEALMFIMNLRPAEIRRRIDSMLKSASTREASTSREVQNQRGDVTSCNRPTLPDEIPDVLKSITLKSRKMTPDEHTEERIKNATKRSVDDYDYYD